MSLDCVHAADPHAGRSVTGPSLYFKVEPDINSVFYTYNHTRHKLSPCQYTWSLARHVTQLKGRAGQVSSCLNTLFPISLSIEPNHCGVKEQEVSRLPEGNVLWCIDWSNVTQDALIPRHNVRYGEEPLRAGAVMAHLNLQVNIHSCHVTLWYAPLTHVLFVQIQIVQCERNHRHVHKVNGF